MNVFGTKNIKADHLQFLVHIYYRYIIREQIIKIGCGIPREYLYIWLDR